jgi:predicted AAA+ superfamily ATPase
MQWDTEPTYVEWQHQLLEDNSDLIVVNGSRQMGKTKMASERVKLAN